MQQVFSILVVCPPMSNETGRLETILSIWSTEQNERFFFNESRLVLELCTLYPEEMARFKLLGKCKAIEGSHLSDNRYFDQERLPSGMSWLWVLKIATALLNHSQSILVIEEVSAFYRAHKTRIYKVLEGTETKLTRAYLDDLEAVLELVVGLLSQAFWVNTNVQLMEELTYIMSHNLIKLFVGVAQGKVVHLAVSKNEIVFRETRVSAPEEEEGRDYRGDQLENIFNLEMRIRTVYCLKYYCLAMEKAFRLSQFDRLYFNKNVLDSHRYLSHFWDDYNRSLKVLLKHSLTRADHCTQALTNSPHLLKVLTESQQAPHTFFSNGYLTALTSLPLDEEELLAEHHLLTYLVAELAVVHYLKQKSYSHKFNALLASYSDAFGRHLKDHLQKVKEERLGKVVEGLVGSEHFGKLQAILDN
jgi:hypothetical protein